ncbi:MAG: hypothetical protein ACLGPL_00255 [Acidobacteriota bacterium]
MEKYLVVAVLLAIGLLGALAVSEGNEVQRQSASCNTLFVKIDSDGKGYLDFLEFRKVWSGPIGYRNMGPYGSARAAFVAADNDGDGRLSAVEYCIWRAHS